jgi:hypothetical protein
MAEIDEKEQDDLALEERIIEEEIEAPMKLDYSLETPEERNELVKKIIEHTPSDKLTSKYLEILADYIIFAMDKEERKKKKILTDNHMVTVNKRETSYEGLVGKLENGEDGIYNMIANDKNIIFTPKGGEITQKDIDEIPALKELVDAIEVVEKQFKAATGKKKFLLKKQLIEMRKDQYVIKGCYHQPMYCVNGIKNFSSLDLSENIIVTEDGKVESDGLISLFNPKHISAILCNYSKLKEDSYGKFKSDAYYFLWDLENLVENTLKEKYPLYYDLIVYKIDGKQNAEIQDLFIKDYDTKYSLEYISSLWRNKIPKMLAEAAEKEYLIWHYTEVEKGQWKRCSKCKQIKLAHNYFFSKNKTSKDGYYSICKECRNKK